MGREIPRDSENSPIEEGFYTGWHMNTHMGEFHHVRRTDEGEYEIASLMHPWNADAESTPYRPVKSCAEIKPVSKEEISDYISSNANKAENTRAFVVKVLMN